MAGATKKKFRYRQKISMPSFSLGMHSRSIGILLFPGTPGEKEEQSTRKKPPRNDGERFLKRQTAVYFVVAASAFALRLLAWAFFKPAGWGFFLLVFFGKACKFMPLCKASAKALSAMRH